MTSSRRHMLALLSVAALPAIAAERGAIYSPVGKRDPFKVPVSSASSRGLNAVSAIEKFTMEQLQLRAVLHGIGKARAMFEDPDGRTHIVREGDLIGRERATISKILNSEVIVTERSFNYLGEETLYEKVISLPADPELGDTGNGPAPVAPSRDGREGREGGGREREGGGRETTRVNAAENAPAGGAAPAAPAAATDNVTIRGGGDGGLVY